jgi:hypothetical protein
MPLSLQLPLPKQPEAAWQQRRYRVTMPEQPNGYIKLNPLCTFPSCMLEFYQLV